MSVVAHVGRCSPVLFLLFLYIRAAIIQQKSANNQIKTGTTFRLYERALMESRAEYFNLEVRLSIKSQEVHEIVRFRLISPLYFVRHAVKRRDHNEDHLSRKTRFNYVIRARTQVVWASCIPKILLQTSI